MIYKKNPSTFSEKEIDRQVFLSIGPLNGDQKDQNFCIIFFYEDTPLGVCPDTIISIPYFRPL